MSAKKATKKTTAIHPSYYDVIVSPVITEKATMASEHGKVVFLVRPDADKQTIKAAVEALFSVKVTKVNTAIRLGKEKLFRGMKGRRSDTKRAVVTLESGQTIDLAAGVK